MNYGNIWLNASKYRSAITCSAYSSDTHLAFLSICLNSASDILDNFSRARFMSLTSLESLYKIHPLRFNFQINFFS